MATLITAHSTLPGKEALYEEFLEQRKLWFVRNLPGMTNYKVYRTEKRFDPSGEASTDVNYTIIAIIEHEGDEDDLTAVYTSESWIEFMGEYLHLLEDDAALYLAHEVPERAQLSSDQFKARASN